MSQFDAIVLFLFRSFMIQSCSYSKVVNKLLGLADTSF